MDVICSVLFCMVLVFVVVVGYVVVVEQVQLLLMKGYQQVYQSIDV